jgi:hypothetical protein
LAVLAAVRPLPFELAAINPHAVQNDGELACDGNFNLPELLLKLDSGILYPSGAGAMDTPRCTTDSTCDVFL